MTLSDSALAMNAKGLIHLNDTCTHNVTVKTTANYQDSLWILFDVVQYSTSDPDCGVNPSDTIGFCVTFKSLYRRSPDDPSSAYHGESGQDALFRPGATR